MEKWSGKVALITGAASGIGRATVLGFVERDATVVSLDIDRHRLDNIVSETGCLGLQVDIRSRVEVDDAVAAIIAQYGRLDFAANIAGVVSPPVPLHEAEEEEWDRIIDINLKGVWLAMRAQIPAMLASGGGRIVNVASAAGLVGSRISPIYGASKHGVVGLTKSAALQYSAQGIRINAVCPGATITPMAPNLAIDEVRQAAEATYPIGRLGTPEDMANAIIWLCSDQADFVCGHALAVDGGFTAQ